MDKEGAPQHRDDESSFEISKDQFSDSSSFGYGSGPFTRPLPRPTGCWAGCIRTPCCLTNRPDRKDHSLQ